MKRILLLQVVLVLIVSCTQTNQTDLQNASPSSVNVSEERLTRIDKMIQQGIDSGWIAGAVGFIARDSKIVYDKSFGVSDLDTKKLMNRDDIFQYCFPDKSNNKYCGNDVI